MACAPEQVEAVQKNLRSKIPAVRETFHRQSFTLQRIEEGDCTYEEPRQTCDCTYEKPRQTCDCTYEKPQETCDCTYDKPQETCDCTYDEPRQTCDCTYDKPKETCDCTYDKPQETCDCTYEEPRQTCDSTYDEPHQTCNCTYEKPQETCDSTYDEPRQTCDCTYEKPQETCDCTYEEPRQTCDCTYEEPRQTCDCTYDEPQETRDEPRQTHDGTDEPPAIRLIPPPSQEASQHAERQTDAPQEDPPSASDTGEGEDQKCSLPVKFPLRSVLTTAAVIIVILIIIPNITTVSNMAGRTTAHPDTQVRDRQTFSIYLCHAPTPYLLASSMPTISCRADIRKSRAGLTLRTGPLANKISPLAVAISNNNDEIFIADYNNWCILVYNTTGACIGHFKTMVLNEVLGFLTRFRPVGVAVDREGGIWVAGHNYVVRYNREGGILCRIFISGRLAYGVAVNSETGEVIVVGCDHKPVRNSTGCSTSIYRQDGTLVRGRFTTGPEMKGPGYVAVGKGGKIFVSDWFGDSVNVYDSKGRFEFSFRVLERAGRKDRLLEGPRGLCSVSSGHILVSDFGNNRVAMFTATGQFVRDMVTDIRKPHGVVFRGRLLVIVGESIKIYTHYIIN
ncbi:PREDICTED: uncharacterized protein LOC109474126 [Branchiostoma belcheri]|uniref:Uncharacterized protein LOC109474126 n=1 Tax=Branchiostoma belcheri TaxID=7741 RepID=A0A6P4ZFL6_BRABE|nr:PREDICTED: uncharacterized protein LOC109474126 [Branchiostoma belcheri]